MRIIKQKALAYTPPMSVYFAKQFVISTTDRFKAIERIFQLECKKDVVDVFKMEKCFAEMVTMLDDALHSYQHLTDLIAGGK